MTGMRCFSCKVKGFKKYYICLINQNSQHLKNYILSEGLNLTQIELAVQKFANMYADTGMTNGIHILKMTGKEKAFILVPPENMDFTRFQFFVNYMRYPEDVDFTCKAIGYYTILATDQVAPDLIGERIMLYVSYSDTAYDNVCGIIKGGESTLKFGFSIGNEFSVLEHKELDFIEQVPDLNNFEALCLIKPESSAVSGNSKGKGCVLTLSLFAVGLSACLFLM